ncbi:MAG: hypothetical protein KDA88_05025 [Planctomycetaceae bacterium]|nr:hypothetical protein [Planctomycetaceae bacterium]MCB9952355.1 hypothetical protein [Planctomycetaceae bacterium]
MRHPSWLVFCLLMAVSRIAIAEEVTKDQILRVWLQRGKSLPTLETQVLEWERCSRKTKVFEIDGRVFRIVAIEGGAVEIEPADVDENVSVKVDLYVRSGTVLLEDSHSRVDLSGQFANSSGRTCNGKKVLLDDGKQNTSFQMYESGGNPFATQYPSKGGTSEAPEVIVWQMLYRPEISIFGEVLADLSLVDEVREIGGHKCCCLEYIPEEAGQDTIRFWFDETNAWQLVEYEEFDLVDIVRRISIDYEIHDELGWAPVRCREDVFEVSETPGERPVTSTRTTRITSVSVPAELSPERWKLEFPHGTVINRNRQHPHLILDVF